MAVQDGNLRVFKWPSMKNVLSEAQAHTTVKDLDFRFMMVVALIGNFTPKAASLQKQNK